LSTEEKFMVGAAVGAKVFGDAVGDAVSYYFEQRRINKRYEISIQELLAREAKVTERIKRAYDDYAEDVRNRAKESLQIVTRSNEVAAIALNRADQASLYEIKFYLENVHHISYSLGARKMANRLKMNAIRNRQAGEKIALIQMYLDDLMEDVLKPVIDYRGYL
jgi:hypothetical protein